MSFTRDLKIAFLSLTAILEKLERPLVDSSSTAASTASSWLNKSALGFFYWHNPMAQSLWDFYELCGLYCLFVGEDRCEKSRQAGTKGEDVP